MKRATSIHVGDSCLIVAVQSSSRAAQGIPSNLVVAFAELCYLRYDLDCDDAPVISSGKKMRLRRDGEKFSIRIDEEAEDQEADGDLRARRS